MLYNIAFFIFSLIYLPALIFKGKLHKDFGQRFGSYDEKTRAALAAGNGTIWIEAVSVGEVALCKSLIPKLKARFPGKGITISTITRAGNELAKKLFANDATIIYFPLDFSFTVRKAVDLIRPKLYIMIETEIWPGVLKALAGRGVPSIVVNGRISDRSFGKYKLAKAFLRNTLGGIGLFCMQSKTDADRIIAMGAPAGKVRVTGNMKFDIDMPKVVSRDSYPWLKPEDELFVAGSTRDGEEEIVIEAFKVLRQKFPNLQLLIAPRHITRVADICKTVERFGFAPVTISSLSDTRTPDPGSRTPVYILDTIGRLNDFYALATLVFVGGSLVKYGGQNPIEPALFEKPVIFGPHMFNFRDVAAAFVRAEGAVQVSSIEDFNNACARLLSNAQARARLGQNARKVVAENRGATEKNIEAIREAVSYKR